MRIPACGCRLFASVRSLYKAGDVSLGADVSSVATKDRDTDVVIQAMLTLNHLKIPGAAEAIASARDAHKSRGTAWVAERILTPPASAGGGRGANLPPDERAAVERGATAYAESCFACHGEDGRGAPMPGGRGLRAPALAGSPRLLGHRDYVAKVILHGLTGPVEGRSYAEVMPPMRASTDRWIADVASYIRNGFGNGSSVLSESDVARVRKETAAREKMWTVEELDRTLPRPLIADAAWRATASHNNNAAAGAFDYTRWSTNAPQEAGMWFRIDLPQPVALTELQFDSPPAGGGRSGAPPAATSPRSYRIEVSTDGNSWTEVAQGQGGARTTTMVFAPVTVRLIRITQTADAKDAPSWSMERLRLFQPAGGSTAK